MYIQWFYLTYLSFARREKTFVSLALANTRKFNHHWQDKHRNTDLQGHHCISQGNLQITVLRWSELLADVFLRHTVCFLYWCLNAQERCKLNEFCYYTMPGVSCLHVAIITIILALFYRSWMDAATVQISQYWISRETQAWLKI